MRSWNITGGESCLIKAAQNGTVEIETPDHLSGRYNSIVANLYVTRSRTEPKENDCLLVGTLSRSGSIGCAYGIAFRDGKWRSSFAIYHKSTGEWIADGGPGVDQVHDGTIDGLWTVHRVSLKTAPASGVGGRGDLFGGAYKDGSLIGTGQINRGTTSADSDNDDHVVVIVAQGCRATLEGIAITTHE